MKKTLTTHEIADELLKDSNARWSRAGAFALAEYLEELEETAGEELELDVCAVRCDFYEYESALEASLDYSWSPEASILDESDNLRPDEDAEEENNERALEWLQDRTSVIQFDGGVIIARF